MGRGRLRIMLGAAPGVGKTFAMLEEGRRLASEGRDVVVAVVETHGREATSALLDGLTAAGVGIVPRRRVEHRGVALDEMDLAAVLARRPELALVDELAHTNAPGSAHEKRWQDVAELLDAGIDVVSTVNIQHIESLNDVVQQITGVPQRETIPDAVLRDADQVELVDLAPQALRDRLSQGLVYPATRVDAALKSLPDRQRLALVHFHYEGMSQVEVGRVLGVSDEAVESLLSRARRTLKGLLKSDWRQLLPDEGNV